MKCNFLSRKKHNNIKELTTTLQDLYVLSVPHNVIGLICIIYMELRNLQSYIENYLELKVCGTSGGKAPNEKRSENSNPLMLSQVLHCVYRG